MRITALMGMLCFLWYLALWGASFSAATTLASFAAALLLVCLLPMALSRRVNERLSMGGLRLGGALLRNVLVFLPYAALVVWLFAQFSGRVGDRSAALYHAVGQALFWLLGALAVYLPDRSEPASPSLCLFAAAPAILLLSATDAQISVVLLCVIGWYFALVFSFAAKSGAALSRAVVFSHSLIPLTVVALAVGLVFSGSLNLLFAQVKQLLLTLWQLLLMLLSLLDAPPEQHDLWPQHYPSLEELLKQEQGPANPLLIIILGVCFAAMLLVLLVRLTVRLLRLRLPQRPPAARRPKGRLGAGLREVLRLLGLLLQGLAGGARALAQALARFARRLCRWGKKRLLALLPPKTPTESVLRSYRGLLRLGRLLRVHYTRSETPMEYLARLQALSPQPPLALAEAQALTWHFVAVQYGGVAPNWQTAAECKRLLRRIRRSSPMFLTRFKTGRLSRPGAVKKL